FFFLVCLVYFRVCGCSYLFGCVYVIFGLFFFFSSRRRHTRSKRDWSSDVCSFDLGCRADFSCSSNRYYLSSWAFMSFLIFVRSRPCASYRGYILSHAYLSCSIYNSTFNKQESDNHVRSSHDASVNHYACKTPFKTKRYFYIGRCKTESKTKKRITHPFSEWLDL